MTAALTVAIVGAGNIAGGYDVDRVEGDEGVYSHAGAYRAQGGFVLETVFDPAPGRAETFRCAWGVNRVATSFSDILDGRHDVVSLCSPDDTHFACLESLLTARCCRTIFVEKPLALRLEDIGQVIDLAERAGINVVCNFQRRFEPVHGELRRKVAENPGALRSVTGHYMKGLHHIGVTMVDSLTWICGYPEAVLAHHRAWNGDTGDFSYEFVLFYPHYTVSVKTVDAEGAGYAFHIFELDFLFADVRSTLVDISRGLRESPVTGYAYGGIRILNDGAARRRETGYPQSMTASAGYIHDVTSGIVPHTINTPQSSFNNALILDGVVDSYQSGLAKLTFGSRPWKK
ncbi:MAG: Gfo/Idh/MocA family oxidoreductase [Rhodospirillaceae bacterium]